MPASLAFGFDTMVKLPELFESEPDPQEINRRQKQRAKIRNITTTVKKVLRILSYMRGLGKTISVEYRI